MFSPCSNQRPVLKGIKTIESASPYLPPAVLIRDPFLRGLRLQSQMATLKAIGSNQRPVLKGIKTSHPDDRKLDLGSNQRPVLKGIKTEEKRD